MFMIATIQSIVSGIADPVRQLAGSPRSGNVNRSTVDAEADRRSPAAATWPPSFPHHGRPRKSSTTPTWSRPPRRAGSRGRRRPASGTRAQGRRSRGSSAIPPSRGIGRAWIRRAPPARSTTPSIRAMRPTAGVSSDARRRARAGSPRGPPGSLDCSFVPSPAEGAVERRLRSRRTASQSSTLTSCRKAGRLRRPSPGTM